ncbi:MAG: signal peptidase II, partial [Bacteroidia bacterium]
VDTFWPDWIPYFGGSRFEFFRPVFNIADAAISIGVFSIIAFRRRLFL